MITFFGSQNHSEKLLSSIITLDFRGKSIVKNSIKGIWVLISFYWISVSGWNSATMIQDRLFPTQSCASWTLIKLVDTCWSVFRRNYTDHRHGLSSTRERDNGPYCPAPKRWNSNSVFLSRRRLNIHVSILSTPGM